MGLKSIDEKLRYCYLPAHVTLESVLEPQGATLEMSIGTTYGESCNVSPRRKLLIFAPHFVPVVGGLEQYVSRLARQLQEWGEWEVLVVTSGSRGCEDSCETIDGITVYRLGYSFRISNTPLGVQWPYKIRSIIARERPDLINAHLPVPGLADIAALVCGDIPFIVTYHMNSMHKGNIRYDLLIWIYERLMVHGLLAKASRIICASGAVQGFLGSYSSKSVVITPAVDTQLFKPAHNQPGSRLLFVGGLTKSNTHKGLSYLLMALAQRSCRDVLLDVVGDGDRRKFYEAECRKLGISDRVRFLGRLDGLALVDRYTQSYALVQPSIRDNLPTTIVEAMACGVPVIASRIGAVTSIVHDRANGILVNPGDVGSLADAIAELFSDPDTRTEYGRAGRKLVESSFTIEDQARRTEELFVEVMGEMRGKVAVVTPYYYPQAGGLENYARHTVRTLREAGFPVVVFTSAHEGKIRVIDQVDGVTVYRLPRLFRVLHTPVHPLWPLWLRTLFVREGVQVINVHTPVPVMADAARLARGRRPVIVTYHNDLVKGSRLGKLVCRLEYYLLTRPTLTVAYGVIATSGYYVKQSRRLRLVQHKIAISSPGVDTSVFSRPNDAEVVPGRFIFVAQLDRTHRHKGLTSLLEAISLARQTVPDLSLTVVGRGNDQPSYVAQARALGLEESVCFAGFVPDEHLRELYASSCAVVLPAENGAEGFGMVILEAAACGVPAVATNVGGIPAAVRDGDTGLLVPPNDVSELASALVRIAVDTELRERLANSAHKRAVTDFSWASQGSTFVDLVRRAVSGRATQGRIHP